MSSSIAPLLLVILPRARTCERTTPVPPTVMEILLPPSAIRTSPRVCVELLESRPAAVKIPPRMERVAVAFRRLATGIVPVSESARVPPLMAMLVVPESLASSVRVSVPPVMIVAPVYVLSL